MAAITNCQRRVPVSFHERHPQVARYCPRAARKLSWKSRAGHRCFCFDAWDRPTRHLARVQEPAPDLGSGRRVHVDDRPQSGCSHLGDWLCGRRRRDGHRARHAGPREVPQVMTMPRTVEEILRHADELAARFESYEPDPAHELDPAAVALLREAVQERSDAERHLVEAVAAARRAGIAWSRSASSWVRQARPPGSATASESLDAARLLPRR
jgi:hypothetical protein